MPSLVISRSVVLRVTILAVAIAAIAAVSGANSVQATSPAQRVTATPPPFATPTPLPPYPPPGGAGMPIEDTRLAGRVPSADIAAALANPDTVSGWGVPRNPNIPYNPSFNPYRTCLTLRNLGVPYHPVYNRLVFKAGCQ